MIKKIRLKNWQTHIDSSFEFPKGINALLGVMGSGKSSVLDAISFAFFGTFPAAQQRRIKLENVITDIFTRHDNAEVTLEFEKEDKIYEIKRKLDRKKTSTSELRCDGLLVESPASQRVTERIEKIIGIDYSTFAQVVYCEQNRLDQFLQIPRGQRMKKIDELLKIDKFETARANIVTLKNRISKSAKELETHTASLRALIDSKDIDTQKKEIEKIELEIKAFNRRLTDIKKIRDTLQKETEILQKKKNIYDEQKNREIKIMTRIEQITDELKNYTNVDDVQSYTPEFIDTQTERLNSVLKKQKSLEKEIAILEEKINTDTNNLNSGNTKLKILESRRPEIEKLKDTETKIEELKTAIEKLLKEEAGINSKIDDTTKSITALEKSDANCPTCDTPLNTEQKTDVIKEKRDQMNTFENSLVIINKEIKTEREKMTESEKKKRELLQYINLEKDILNTSETIKQIDSQLKTQKNKLEDSKKIFSSDKIKKIEQEIRRFETTKTILRHIHEKRHLEEEKKQIKINIDELKFKPEELEKKLTEFIAHDKLYSTDIVKLRSLQDMYKEKAKNLSVLKDQAKLVKTNEKQIEMMKDRLPELERFKIVLETTQIMLREQFIESINNIMEDLWFSVYPYKDYTGIQISVDEGDYILQLRNMDDTWMNVEGTVSGGERMTAVLVLRIAMSTVLAPGMKMLLLDEPTHNLDRKAVEELAETLRTKVSDIVDQVFLITHDEAMETAVTGKLYRLNRGENKEDVTEVIEI
ncbi:MAG: AAA family ATPase [Nanohaloarchaea archaeon]|nr:AAA family ATPase [Candidatus Nanohaloarchaea archaeon]